MPKDWHRLSSHRVTAARTVRVSIIRNGIPRVFASRLRRAGGNVERIIIASPWITEESGGAITSIAASIKRRETPTLVFTRPPDSATHFRALDTLLACPTVELVYNTNLHAKVYACVAPYPHGFAILGSANLTQHSEQLYEIGLLVLAGGGGDEIVRELAGFGLDYLRTRPESKLVRGKKRGR